MTPSLSRHTAASHIAMTTDVRPTTWDAALTDYRLWLIAGGRRPGTIRLRTHYLIVLARHHHDPWAITADDLVRFMATDSWSPETRKSARASLRRFYGWAVLTHRISESPADILLPVLVPRKVQRAATEQLIDTALARASQRDRLMLLLGSRAGLRRVEIASLRLDEIDLAAGCMIITGKGGQQRIVPFAGVLAAELTAEVERRSRGILGMGWRFTVDPYSPWLFPAQRDGHMSADTVGAIITRCMRDAATPHGLRRRFATRAYGGTRDIRAVQELLGHASPETTARYIGVDRSDLDAAVLAAA